jgi:predicted DNA-binding transcriptional regulator AlpA
MTDILKVPDVLRRYRITKPTLRRWLRAGRFPAPFVVANRSMWRASDIEAFELNRRQS